MGLFSRGDKSPKPDDTTKTTLKAEIILLAAELDQRGKTYDPKDYAGFDSEHKENW